MEDNWEKVRLDEIIQIKHGYAFDGDYFVDEETGLVVVTPGNFRIGGGFKKDSLKWYSSEGPLDNEYVLESGDLLVTMTDLSKSADTLGYSARVPDDQYTYLHNQRIGLINTCEEVDDKYLEYAMRTYEYRQQVVGSSSGSTVHHTSPSKIGQCKIPLPPVPVQKRIGEILDAYDSLIKNNRRRIELLEEMAASVFREWFLHYRFPGRKELETRSTEIGEIPDLEGWEIKELKEVSTVNRENLSDSSAPEKIHYLTISNVNEGGIEEPESMAWGESPSRAKRIVKHGDTIWGSVRPRQKSYGLMLHPRPNTIVSTGFAVLTPGKLPYSYLYQYVTTEGFISYLDNVATGATYPSANVSDFKKAKILRPPDSLVEQYHKYAEPIYEQIQNLGDRNQVLQEMLDLLMPRLVAEEFHSVESPVSNEAVI